MDVTGVGIAVTEIQYIPNTLISAPFVLSLAATTPVNSEADVKGKLSEIILDAPNDIEVPVRPPLTVT